MMKLDKTGFSLIELLIVFSLIGIVLAFGFSSYTSHTTLAKRMLAASVLTQMAEAMEEYQMTHDSYAHAPLLQMVSVPKQLSRDYEFVLSSANENEFVLMAKPRGTQAQRDKECGTLMLHSTGEKIPEKCW